MSESLDFGIPGTTLEPGDHLCALYFGGRERDEILRPYLHEGLRAGDKCVCVVDTTTPAAVVETLRDGIDIDGCVGSRQLEVMSADDSYLQGGRFSTQAMLSFYGDAVATATGEDGYSFARIAGEASWVLRDPPGAEELIEYESGLNRFTPQYPQAVLCLYDLERFGGGMIVDLLKTHPKLLLGGLVIENPHYLTPDEFRAQRS